MEIIVEGGNVGGRILLQFFGALVARGSMGQGPAVTLSTPVILLAVYMTNLTFTFLGRWRLSRMRSTARLRGTTRLGRARGLVVGGSFALQRTVFGPVSGLAPVMHLSLLTSRDLPPMVWTRALAICWRWPVCSAWRALAWP